MILLTVRSNRSTLKDLQQDYKITSIIVYGLESPQANVFTILKCAGSLIDPLFTVLAEIVLVAFKRLLHEHILGENVPSLPRAAVSQKSQL